MTFECWPFVRTSPSVSLFFYYTSILCIFQKDIFLICNHGAFKQEMTVVYLKNIKEVVATE